MKKLNITCILLCFLMVMHLCMPAFAVEAPTDSPATLRSSNTSIVKPSSYLGLGLFCDHSNSTINVGDIISEDCVKIVYNYTQTCNLCGKEITGGPLNVFKNPPSHTFTWVTFGCGGGQHTYERRCTKCGYAAESMTVRCNGNCIEFQSLDNLLQ